MAVRTLSMSDLRALVDGGELKKGQIILDQGKLDRLARTDTKLYAEAAGSGSSPYQASITFDDQGKVLGKRGRRGNCTCRAAWSRDFCKHAAALLLAWAKTPEAFAVTEAPAADQASTKNSTGPRRRSKKAGASASASSPKVDGDALKQQGAGRVDTLVRELAVTGVGSTSKERVAQLDELAANLFQLQLPRLQLRTLDLARLLERSNAAADSLRITSALADMLLTAVRIKAHFNGKPLEDRHVTELIGKSWQKKDRTPARDLDLVEYAYSQFTNTKKARISTCRFLDLRSGEHYMEMQITPQQILSRTSPLESYAGKVLEGTHGTIFPGFPPRRIKPEGDEHRRRVSSADVERMLGHATPIDTAIATFGAHRRDVFAPSSIPVLVRTQGIVAQGSRLRIFDEAGTTVHLRASAGLEQRMSNALEGRTMHAVFGELDLEHAIPTLWPTALIVREPKGLALRSAGKPRRGDQLPEVQPWAEVAREAGLSYAAVSVGEIREELADVMVGGLTGLDVRASEALVERLRSLTLAKPAQLLATLAANPDPAQRVSGFVKLFHVLKIAMVRLAGAATIEREGLVPVPTHASIYIPDPPGRLPLGEALAARLAGTITRYEAAVHYHRHYQTLEPAQMADDLMVLADGGAASYVVETIARRPQLAVAVAEKILGVPLGMVPLRTAFRLLTRAATPEAELILKAYSGKHRRVGKRFGQQVVHMADDALIELQHSRPRLSPMAESRRDHLEYKLGPLLTQACSDKDAERRALGCESLAMIGATSAIPELRSLFRDDPSSKVREQAALSLAMLGDAQIVEELLIAVRRPGPKAKSMAHVACRALGHLGDSRALPVMVELYREGFSSTVLADAWLRLGVLALEPIAIMLDAQPALSKRSALAAPLERMPVSFIVDHLLHRLWGSSGMADLDDEALAERVIIYLRLCTDNPPARHELARRLFERHIGGRSKHGKRALAAIRKLLPSR